MVDFFVRSLSVLAVALMPTIARGQGSVSGSIRQPLIGPWNASQQHGVWYNPRCGKHLGEDIPRMAGTPVYPLARGTVKFAEFVNELGYAIILEHESPPVTSTYFHLKTPAEGGLAWQVGQEVDPVRPIGFTTGTSGQYGTGPHLHFGIRRGSYEGGDDPRTRRWRYPGYSTIYGSGTKKCDASDRTHDAVLSSWEGPSDLFRETLVVRLPSSSHRDRWQHSGWRDGRSP